MGSNEAGETGLLTLPSSPLPSSRVRPGKLLCLTTQEEKGPCADLNCTDQRGNRKTPDGPLYLSVSCRLLPLDKEIERKKPWTAGTVYNKRVLDKSC